MTASLHVAAPKLSAGCDFLIFVLEIGIAACDSFCLSQQLKARTA